MNCLHKIELPSKHCHLTDNTNSKWFVYQSSNGVDKLIVLGDADEGNLYQIAINGDFYSSDIIGPSPIYSANDTYILFLIRNFITDELQFDLLKTCNEIHYSDIEIAVSNWV